MFSAKLDALLLSLRPPSAVRLAPDAQERMLWADIEPRYAVMLTSRAERARSQGIPQLYFGDLAQFYKEGQETYRRDQDLRREWLKALALGHLVKGEGLHIARIADLIWAICEEASWADPENYYKSRFSWEPIVDERAARTAEALAVCCHLISDIRLRPVRERALAEIRARVLDPLIQREDWPFLLSTGRETLRILECILTAALIAESDDRSRWLCVRKAVGALDTYMDRMMGDGGFDDSLEEHIRATAALSACLRHIAQASGGEVDCRDDVKYRNMVRLPCALHIGEGWFVNPGGAMRPAIDPAVLYQMGKDAGDTETTGLASFLNRRQMLPRVSFEQDSDPLLRQVMYALARAELERAPARSPLYPAVELPSMRTITHRGEGFFVALCGAGDRRADGPADVGDLCLFYRGAPVLVFTDAKGSEYHNLPTIDGVGQTPGRNRAAEDMEVRQEGMYTLFSMNIARAYPERVYLQSWQRSVMLVPLEEGVRLIDVFDFDRMDAQVAFHFQTMEKPAIEGNSARLGPVHMDWEEGLIAAVEPWQSAAAKNGEMYRLTLRSDESARDGSYTFIFRAAEQTEDSSPRPAQ